MKGKSKYLVLLLLLLVVCGGMVTYAIYKTNKSGNATVNAARWNVVFKNGENEIENNFNIQLSNATWTNPLGSVASGKIAPGSEATFYITIDATNTETDVDYTAEIDESFDESDFEVTLADDSGTIPYSTTENAMIRQIPIRVVWNGNINDDDNKNSDDLLKRARDITIPIKLTAAQKLVLPYTIRFSSEGNIISTIKVAQNTSIGTLPSAPTRNGYSFKGWYTSEEGGTRINGEEIAIANTTYYAQWKAMNFSVGSLVYYDPKTYNLCDEDTFDLDAVKNNTSTCYKWRVIDVDTSGSTLNIQLDHNLVNTAYWGSTNTGGPTNALSSLTTSTSSWTRVNPLNYEYDTTASPESYGILRCNNGICNYIKNNIETFAVGTNEVPVRARLITGEEVAAIAGDSTWALNNAHTITNLNTSTNQWVFDNTTSNNYAGGNSGYWTLSSAPGGNNYVYVIWNRNGTKDCERLSSWDSGYVGIRPVITVPKTDLN